MGLRHFCWEKYKSPGVSWCIGCCVASDALEECSSFSFRIKDSKKTLWPWSERRRYYLPKRREVLTQLYRSTNTAIQKSSHSYTEVLTQLYRSPHTAIQKYSHSYTEVLTQLYRSTHTAIQKYWISKVICSVLKHCPSPFPLFSELD